MSDSIANLSATIDDALGFGGDIVGGLTNFALSDVALAGGAAGLGLLIGEVIVTKLIPKIPWAGAWLAKNAWTQFPLTLALGAGLGGVVGMFHAGAGTAIKGGLIGVALWKLLRKALGSTLGLSGEAMGWGAVFHDAIAAKVAGFGADGFGADGQDRLLLGLGAIAQRIRERSDIPGAVSGAEDVPSGISVRDKDNSPGMSGVGAPGSQVSEVASWIGG